MSDANETLSIDFREVQELARLLGDALEPPGITDPVDRDAARRLCEKLTALALEMEPGAFLELA